LTGYELETLAVAYVLGAIGIGFGWRDGKGKEGDEEEGEERALHFEFVDLNF
jgi:hypothetical protein